MPYEWGCADDDEPEKHVAVLGLQKQEQRSEQVSPDKESKEHANAYLVIIALADIVDNAGNCADDEQYEDGNLSYADARIVERGLKTGQRGKMASEQGEVILINKP